MILLIGNGPSGDRPEVAAAMRNASRVMRMNNWQPGVHTGTRCDIWGTSFNHDIIVRDALDTWWTGWPYGHRDVTLSYEEVLARQSNHYDRVASKELIDRAFAGTDKWVSTGVILAMMFQSAPQGLLRAKPTGDPRLHGASLQGRESIALAGFDHFGGEDHHYWDSQPEWDPLEYHDPEHERRIVAELGAEII